MSVTTHRIGIVGSVHLDVLAEYDWREDDSLDRPGQVRFAIGGTAFNVAAALSVAGLEVRLYTHLRNGSLINGKVLEALRSYGISDRLVCFDEEMPESAFVAHLARTRGDSPLELVSAVTCCGIEAVSLDLFKVEASWVDVDAAVVECNLSSEQLGALVMIARRLGKRLMIGAVSEQKASRLLEVVRRCDWNPFELVCMNRREAEALGLPSSPSKADLAELREACGAANLIVTMGESGLWAVLASGEITRWRATVPAGLPESTLGAGDAVFAGMTAHMVTQPTSDWKTCSATLSDFVRASLMAPTAVRPGAKL